MSGFGPYAYFRNKETSIFEAHATVNGGAANSVDSNSRSAFGMGRIALDDIILVVGWDGNLWREHFSATGSPPRELIDSNVLLAEGVAAVTSSSTFVLKSDSTLWIESINANGGLARGRIATSVKQFKQVPGANGAVVYYLQRDPTAQDHSLYRFSGNSSVRMARDVYDFYTTNDQNVYYRLDLSKDLWRVNLNDGTITKVDGNVASAAPVPGSISDIYVLGTDGKLWLERGNWQNRGSEPVDSNVRAFAPAGSSRVVVVSAIDGKVWSENNTWRDRFQLGSL